VINLQSDGDALFTPSALWTAARYRVPPLTVMDNNRSYNSVKHAVRVAHARGRPLENALVANTIDEPTGIADRDVCSDGFRMTVLPAMSGAAAFAAANIIG
jgi:thiamine pyrophosphate-dependent acetolactate synthase large subunit-like protein